MSESMVERVARAIQTVRERDGGPAYDAFDGIYDRRTADRLRESLNEEARAAIEAMREPTDLMGLGLPSDYKPGSHSATQIWRSMIDAALAPAKIDEVG